MRYFTWLEESFINYFEASKMDNKPKPNFIAIVIFWSVVCFFFGGALLLFINAFVPFLSEGALAIIGLPFLAFIIVGCIVGKCVSVVQRMRRIADYAESSQDKPTGGNDNNPTSSINHPD